MADQKHLSQIEPLIVIEDGSMLPMHQSADIAFTLKARDFKGVQAIVYRESEDAELCETSNR